MKKRSKFSLHKSDNTSLTSKSQRKPPSIPQALGYRPTKANLKSFYGAALWPHLRTKARIKQLNKRAYPELYKSLLAQYHAEKKGYLAQMRRDEDAHKDQV